MSLNSDGSENTGKKSKNVPPGKRRFFYLMIIAFLLLLVTIRLKGCRKEKWISTVSDPVPVVDTTVGAISDTVALVDTAESIIDTITDNDTSLISPGIDEEKEVASTSALNAVDTVVTDSLSVDRTVSRDTIKIIPSLANGCVEDTSELWVFPDPSGGLHYGSVTLEFISNRQAKIHYRLGNDTLWQLYGGNEIVLDTSVTLYYDAIDSCENIMEVRSEYYEIERKDNSSPCSDNMAYVKLGSMDFCIDRYEWPNRRRNIPSSFVSYYQAADSCFSVGKRLCTSDEWKIACSGPYSWNYPYGSSYERYGCVTHDTAVVPSGKKVECRSYYGLYDMSGNLLEWTSTKSVENSSFYYVMGGFWDSGPKSGCFDKRYSYYPQNQHNPVGFRCCRDRVTEYLKPVKIGK